MLMNENNLKKRKGAGAHSGSGVSGGAGARHATGSPSASGGAGARSAHAPKSRTLDTQAVAIPFEHGQMTITRRQLMYIAGGVAALGVVGGGAYAFNQVFGEHELVEESVDVPTSAVSASTEFSQLEQDSCVALTGDFKLSFGTMLWCNSDTLAACLVPGDTGNPLTKVDLLHFSTGNTDTVLEAAAGAAEGFQILDVRATTSGLVWVESDILEQTWRVYTATLKQDGALGTPVCADAGDADWELPSIAISDDMAFWQVQPATSGGAAKSQTALKACALGGKNVQVLWESAGHCACAVNATDKYVVIAPRAQSGSGVRYRLTCLDAKTGAEVDSLVLPSTMKPTDVTYCDTGFAFSFDAIYSNSTGISNIGTYVPAQKVAAAGSGAGGSGVAGGTSAEGASASGGSSAGSASNSADAQGTSATAVNSEAYSNANWFRWARTPVCAPANCGNFLVVKSTTAVCGVNLAANTYFAIDTDTGCEDYGDMLATTGAHKNFVTYSNVTTKPLSGDSEQYCHVRVWESL